MSPSPKPQPCPAAGAGEGWLPHHGVWEVFASRDVIPMDVCWDVWASEGGGVAVPELGSSWVALPIMGWCLCPCTGIP